jgi:hypothetical protein
VPEEVSIVEPKGLTSKILSEVFRYFEAGMVLFEDHDPDFERSSKVSATLVRNYACYTEIYREKKRLSSSQTTLDSYFRKRPTPSTSTESPSLASTSTQSPTPSIAASRSSSKSPARKRLALDGSTYDVEDMPSPLDFLQKIVVSPFYSVRLLVCLPILQNKAYGVSFSYKCFIYVSYARI